MADWPVLETERLILRRFRMDDAPDMFEYASDPDVTRFLVIETHKSIDETRAFLEMVLSRPADSHIMAFGIVLKESGKLVGHCAIFSVDARGSRSGRAEVGYAVNPAYRGPGIAPEALRAVIDLGFGRLGLNRIAALAMLDNPASTRVMEKAGMRYEGILREYMLIKGRHHDLMSYSIVRKDWDGQESGVAISLHSAFLVLSS
jgi:ribosomal-protein-alanine N-acetyltransferase